MRRRGETSKLEWEWEEKQANYDKRRETSKLGLEWEEKQVNLVEN